MENEHSRTNNVTSKGNFTYFNWFCGTYSSNMAYDKEHEGCMKQKKVAHWFASAY